MTQPPENHSRRPSDISRAVGPALEPACLAQLLRHVARHPVTLGRPELRLMTRTMQALVHLASLPAYREAILAQASPVARFDPGHHAVMMGYDFHLSPEGAHLIEVNTNAGGGLLAAVAQFYDPRRDTLEIPPALPRRVLSSFMREYALFRRRQNARPQLIAIMDEAPQEQFLYPEMRAFARLFESEGIRAVVVSPAELQAGADGVFHQGARVEMIYNRHCDFYLESAQLHAVRAAYLAGTLCLSPNPFAFALLADKRRMILWSDAQALRSLGVAEPVVELLARVVPRTRLLAQMGREQAWAQRKELVFKPASLFGSKGVYMGASISRTRFDALPPEETLAQQLQPPPLLEVSGHAKPFKYDVRLFAYHRQLLGLAARLYQGQVTNMQTPGGGFAPLQLENEDRLAIP